MKVARPEPMPDWQYAWQIELAKQAPDFGLGFQLQRIPEWLYRILKAQLANNIESFVPEPTDPFLNTVNAKGFPALVHRDTSLDAPVIEALQPVLETWCGFELVSSAVFGIRAYQRGSYLYPHVDQAQSHVISATLCIAQELEASWPLSIQNQAGDMEQVDLAPGQMVLYESSRLLHGRETALQGKYYASVFAHFAPPPSATSLA